MDKPTNKATADLAARASRRRNRSPRDASYVRQRVSPHTGIAYWWGDFRRFKDVGGKHERLSTYLAPGEAIQNDEEARTVYWQAVALYQKRRKSLAAGETVDISTTAAGAPKAVRGLVPVEPQTSPSAAQVIAQPVEVGNLTAKGEGVAELAAQLARLMNIKPPKGGELRLQAAAKVHLERKRADAKIGHGQESTCDTDATSFKALTRLLGAETRLVDISADMLKAYITTRLHEPGWVKGTQISPNTVRAELAALSNLYTQLGEHDEYTFGNPVRNVRKPKPPSDESEYLQLDELARLLDAAAQEDEETDRARRAMELVHSARAEGARGRPRTADAQRRLDEAEALYPTAIRGELWHRRFPYVEALFALLAYTGPRFEEGRGLQVEELDWGREEVIYRKNEHRSLKTANGTHRVPICAELARILRHHQMKTGIRSGLLLPGEGGGMAGSLQKVIPRCVERASIGRVITAHAFRHTFATAMLHTYVISPNGILVQRSSFQVARLLGHTNSRQVDRTYGHLLWNAGMMTEFSADAHRKYPSTRLGRGRETPLGSSMDGQVVPAAS
jgi:integrase